MVLARRRRATRGLAAATRRGEGLTPAREALAPPLVNRWIDKALALAPADRALVADGLRRVYEHWGRRWHGNVVWVDSPVVGQLAASAAADACGGFPNACQEPCASWAQAIPTYHDPLPTYWKGQAPYGRPDWLRLPRQRRLDQARYLAWDTVLRPVEGVTGALPWWSGELRRADLRQAGARVDDGLLAPALAAVEALRPGRPCRANTVASVLGVFARYGRLDFWGPLVEPHITRHARLAEAAFLRELCGFDPIARWETVEGWADAGSAGWWWAFDDAALVVERPVELHTETLRRSGPPGRPELELRERRPHRAGGPAVRWRDGQTLNAWHGTLVPDWVVGGDLTPERIDAEPNAELRRCAIERYGWERYVGDKGLTPIASDRWGRLYRDPDHDDRLVVVVVNGTPERDGTLRRYQLSVPATVTTPLEAVAWTYGLAPDQYALVERRT